MSIGIGIIGAGVMGADHARIVASETAGAHVAGIADADGKRAAAVAEASGGAAVFADPLDLIGNSKVDAVLIASPDATHATYTLACLDAKKPVLCEKPLAPTTEECLKVLAAETAAGRRLIQVGFMRRFDPAYAEMKRQLLSGKLGEALMLHCAHRNVASPPWWTAGMSVTNSAVHEFDVCRWLLDTEYQSIRVMQGRQSRNSKFQEPLLIVIETALGQIIDIEIFINAVYGYDVRTEMVCENGTIDMTPPGHAVTRAHSAASFAFAPDWRPRFADAYRLQMQDWVRNIPKGSFTGASAWDGYVATAVAEAGLAALASGQAAPVVLKPKPRLYA